MTLPGGLGTFAIDLGASAHQLTDVSDTRTYRAAMTPMPDHRPIALVDTLAATEDEPLSARVHAARLPETVPVFAVVADPSSGSLASFDSETGTFAYQGSSDFFGSDSFRFSVSDGTLPATEAVVRLDVAGTQDPPVARSQSVTTPEDTAIGITLDASDADGDPLTLTITAPPASGSLAGTLPAPTYTPNADYAGSDSFAYRVSNGTASSMTATVSITVSPVNDRPVALPQALTTRGTNRSRILLRATDVDDARLTYAVTRAPTGGTLTGTAPNLVYRATADFTGADTFAFTASDATLTSTEAIVTVDVLPAIYSTEVLSSSFPISLVERLVAASRIYFTGYHPTSGSSLWVTDGTPTGTTLVHSEGARSTSFSHAASAYFALGASEYYIYPNDYPAMQLRAGTDGSVIAPLPSPDETVYRGAVPVIGSPAVAGGTAYVHVNWSGSAGGVCEIWATDGTAGGTRLVNSVARHCRGIHDGGGTFYYFEGFDLMTLTAAAETPALIPTIPAGILGWLGTAGCYHFFSRQHTVGSGVTSTTYVELWRTDGTAGGTMLVDTVDTGYITFSIYYPTALGGLLYFSHRRSLHASDGTTAGTGIVWNVPATSYGGSGAISYMSAVNGALFFQARSDATGGEPWVSDGTSAGATLLADVKPRNDVGSMRNTTPPRPSPALVIAPRCVTHRCARHGCRRSSTLLLRRRDLVPTSPHSPIAADRPRPHCRPTS